MLQKQGSPLLASIARDAQLKAAAQQHQYPTFGGTGLATEEFFRGGADAPIEPSVYARATEALKWITEAVGVAEKLSVRITGPTVCENSCGNKDSDDPSLDRILTIASQRAASLVSILSTLGAKIG